MGFWDVRMTLFSLLPPLRLFKGSLPLHCVCTATFITAQTWWLNRASDKFSLILATKRQLPAQEHRGIVKVVTEDISPFKRKSKNLGKTFLLPPHFSWVHTGAVGGSKSSSAPQEQGYCISLKLHQGREAGAGNWARGARGYLSMATDMRVQVAEQSFSSSLQPDTGEGFHRRTPPPWPLDANFKGMIQLCLFWHRKQKYSPNIFIRASDLALG